MIARLGTLFDGAIDAFVQPGRPRLAFACVFALLLLEMAPLAWHQNELHYLYLAHRMVAPERFSEFSAIFDDSAARIVSFGILGLMMEIFGAEATLVISRILMAASFALAFAALARAWSLSAAELLIGLIAFIWAGQSYVAGEWLFVGTETKTLAYAAVIASIACGSSGRPPWAVVWAALATYFHFLVGGFWAVAVLLLAALQGMPVRQACRGGLLYVLLVLPLLIVLVYEQVILPAPELPGSDMTLNEIYSLFRNPHHVAPFRSAGTFLHWLPRISVLVAATAMIGVVLAYRGQAISRPLAIWIFMLHLYVILAFVAAFLDRNTHFLGPFFVFRPNSLAMLLFLVLMVHWLRLSLADHARRWLAVLAVVAVPVYASPILLQAALIVHRGEPIPARLAFPDEDRRALVEWLKDNTGPEDVVLLERTAQTDWQTQWIAFERMIDRPTLVSFKFVPSAKHDLARWYRLMRWRDSVFEGNCGALSEQPVAYLVTVRPSTRDRVADCGRVLWTSGDYAVIGDLRTPRTEG